MLIALSMGLANGAYAGSDSYFPPERIHCTLNTAGKLSCFEFDRHYLAEDLSTADLEQGKDEIFYFSSGSAYFTPDQKEVTVFYTYKNAYLKTIKLKSVSPSIRPALENSGWKKLNDGLYTCLAGYMRCPITL